MAKSRILKVINYRQEDIPVLEELEKTLKREGKEYSEWGREQTIEYVKVHGKGNPAFTLDGWQGNPGMIGYPSPWGGLSRDSLKECSEDELLDMERRLARAMDTIVTVRQRPVASKKTGASR